MSQQRNVETTVSLFVINISAMLPSTRGYLGALAGQTVSKVIAKNRSNADYFL